MDHLIGLKENVIIGKLIPAGSGLSMYRQVNPPGGGDGGPATAMRRGAAVQDQEAAPPTARREETAWRTPSRKAPSCPMPGEEDEVLSITLDN